MEFRGAQPPFMENKKLIRFVQSLMLLPIMTMSMPLGNIVPKSDMPIVLTEKTVLSQKENIGTFNLLAFNQGVDGRSEEILKMKGDAIDDFFREHDMPLEGKGIKLAEEAEKNDLDWRLLAAISVRESTGGKFACKRVKNNPFGWGSCKIGFNSMDEAIETVGRNLGGNNPNTAHHYADKGTFEILQKYNPPSIVKYYAEQVIAIMDEIGEKEITTENA